MTARRIVTLLLVAAALTLGTLGVLVFQDDLAKFALAPKTPFQVTRPPPAPEYGARGAWLLWPDKDPKGGAADIFYVHSTTYASSAGWNGPIGAGAAESALKLRAAPNEAGPFLGLGALYGPRYRQATLFAEFTQKFDGVAARSLAYQDVKRAFRHYLRNSAADRPIILVGYGQGGQHVQGLLVDFFQADEATRRRLATAYVIDQAVPLALFDDALASTPPCTRPGDVRCVISYIAYEARFGDEITRTKTRSTVFNADGELVEIGDAQLLCVNPLDFTPAPQYQPASEHLGAASATGLRFGATPPQVSNAVGAQCVDGILVVDRPRQDYLRRRGWFGAKWRPQHFNLFYFDLAEDAAQRVASLRQRLDEEAQILDPIGESVDLEVSPVNKVPNL